MLDLNQNENNFTPLPSLINERLTNNLIRLASTQLELAQELTSTKFYHILHFPSPLSNLNSHHLSLIHQLNTFVNSSLQQIIDMQNPSQQNEDNMSNEEDENMKDQVVPGIQIRVPSFPMQTPQTQPSKEEAPNMLDPLTQTLYWKNTLTLDKLLSIEMRFLIKVPRELNKVDLNIRCYNS